MRRMVLKTAAVVFALGIASANAQDYPTRPVRIVFPLAAGGGGDVYTRALADELQRAWRQPVVVENRPGGGQVIGARACAEAKPDGYTLCVMSSEPVTYNQFLYKTIPYDPGRDFLPITGLFFNTLALVVNPDTQVKTFAEMIALAKARPGKLSYATFAYPAAYFMNQLNKAEGTDIVRVPYRGGGEVVNALLGNTTPIAILALSNMVAHLESGRIVPLAVTGKSRSPLLPNVPTLAEVRPGAELRATWFGLFTQSGVPRPIVEKIAHDADRIMAEPSFRKRIYVDRAVEPAMERLGAFADFIRKERVIAEQIVKDSGEPPR